MLLLFRLVWRIVKLLSIAVIALALLLVYAREVEPNLLLVSREEVAVRNLAEAFDGLRIVQISDLHGREFTKDKLTAKVNSLQADILVITGDVIDRQHDDLSYIERVIGPMQAKYGKFFVTGNNEYSYGISLAKMNEAYRRAGVKVLNNTSFRLDKGGSHFWLVGVEDPNTNRHRLSLALKNTNQAPKILLAHSPEIINEAADQNIELVLTGHTHGGQIRLPGLSQRPELKNDVEQALEKADYWLNRGLKYIWAKLDMAERPKIDLPKPGPVLDYNMKPGFEKYVSGFYQAGDTTMYVNRGIGETRIPFRLFSPPEIAVFELIRQNTTQERKRNEKSP